MFHPIITNQLAKIRYNEMLEEAEQYRRAKKFSQKRSWQLPKLSHLFAGRKSDESTAVSVQAQ